VKGVGVNQLLELLVAYGPALLFTLAVLETSFVTGLFVPSGVATSLATVLALQGRVELVPMIVAATAGGAVGDSIGFWVGRCAGERALLGDGPWARRIAPGRAALERLYGKHPVYSVTVARLISFVRTMMPMAAGMSGLPYRTYLLYELVGLVGWTAMYVAIGVLARESWGVANQLVGVGGTAVFAVVGVSIWILMKRSDEAASDASAGDADA
jgi:membrane-associated protein